MSFCPQEGRAWLVVARGHVWLPGGCAGLPGGMRGCWRLACILAGGVCDCHVGHGCWEAMVNGGHAWLPGGCIGYDEIRSMSGRYASYWNAFLFTNAETNGFFFPLKKCTILSHLLHVLDPEIINEYSRGLAYLCSINIFIEDYGSVNSC